MEAVESLKLEDIAQKVGLLGSETVYKERNSLEQECEKNINHVLSLERELEPAEMLKLSGKFTLLQIKAEEFISSLQPVKVESFTKKRIQ